MTDPAFKQTDRGVQLTSGSDASFTTRARTIDHLGRGQIADAPTAVSELWKNAWDAYAKDVSLNIFDGKPVTAAIFDDGVGMNTADFIERWLVIGTEIKISGERSQPPPGSELEFRARQGEKGIGRLSAAFLAPASVVISKTAGGSYAAILVDWRLFENPYLSLDAIKLPVRQFDEAKDILTLLSEMSHALLKNLGDESGDAERESLAIEAWDKFTKYEKSEGKEPTIDRIRSFWNGATLAERELNEWPVAAGLSETGTAIYLLDTHHELSVWVESEHEDDEVRAVKDRLKDILTGFTDTLRDDPVKFGYEVLAYRGLQSQRIISSSDTFALQDFRSLEHYIEGQFDAEGVFTGKLRAFGQDRGEIVLPPSRKLPTRSTSRPGPFRFSIGTFEQMENSSSHSSSRHADLMGLVDLYGGVRVYRDGLRVMPYGSAEADFLLMEERRQKNAGRYFWAYRRSFGKLAFSSEGNPNLKDKAGREGLVENRASREMRLLVQNVLLKTALSYFGSGSDDRSELIAEAKLKNLAAKKKADDIRKTGLAVFRSQLAHASERLPELRDRSENLQNVLASVEAEPDTENVALARGLLEEVRAEAASLSFLHVPSRLGASEKRYRAYRDEMQSVQQTIDTAADELNQAESEVGKASPKQILAAVRKGHETAIHAVLDSYEAEIRGVFRDLTGKYTEELRQDRERYTQATDPIVRKATSQTDLSLSLTALEETRNEVMAEVRDRYPSMIYNISQIAKGADLATAFANVDDEAQELGQRVKDLNATAQLGITVEIIGHELEGLDNEVTRSLERLEADPSDSSRLERAKRAHMALTEKLRFLTPLKLSGTQLRERISGADIYDYLQEFFKSILVDNHIDLTASEEFLSMSFDDMTSRIYPTFINLVNNAIYWVNRSDPKEIKLHYRDNTIIIADSGNGVDADDQHRLFELFFSKRRGGHGVGLYLSRVNLQASGHQISYISERDAKILSGANFAIEIGGHI